MVDSVDSVHFAVNSININSKQQSIGMQTRNNVGFGLDVSLSECYPGSGTIYIAK